MKILILTRNSSDEQSQYARALVTPLANQGHIVTVLDASHQIPDQTGSTVDKDVSVWLRQQSESFDIVHAMGYRAAWACAECFGSREAWVYSAYDMPFTTHRFLINRLNESQAGVCSSRAVYRALDEALTMTLHTIYPGIDSPTEIPTQTQVRELLKLPADGKLVGAHYAPGEKGAMGPLIEAMRGVWENLESAKLVLFVRDDLARVAGDFVMSTNHDDDILIRPLDQNSFDHLRALDIFVHPGRGVGFSTAVVEAMSRGVPCLVRHSGGLSELVEPDVSGFVFPDDENLKSQLAELITLELTLETVGRAGKVRALERFTIDRSAQLISEIYEMAVCP